MNRKKFNEEVLLVRRAIIQAMPTGISFAAIIIALAQLIERYQEQALEEDDASEYPWGNSRRGGGGGWPEY